MGYKLQSNYEIVPKGEKKVVAAKNVGYKNTSVEEAMDTIISNVEETAGTLSETNRTVSVVSENLNTNITNTTKNANDIKSLKTYNTENDKKISELTEKTSYFNLIEEAD